MLRLPELIITFPCVLDFRLDKGTLIMDKKNFLMIDLGNTDLLKDLHLTDDSNNAPNLATVEKGK